MVVECKNHIKNADKLFMHVNIICISYSISKHYTALIYVHNCSHEGRTRHLQTPTRLMKNDLVCVTMN